MILEKHIAISTHWNFSIYLNIARFPPTIAIGILALCMEYTNNTDLHSNSLNFIYLLFCRICVGCRSIIYKYFIVLANWNTLLFSWLINRSGAASQNQNCENLLNWKIKSILINRHCSLRLRHTLIERNKRRHEKRKNSLKKIIINAVFSVA